MAAAIESQEIFARGPDGRLTAQGQAQRWTMEFHAARERLKKAHEQGEKILDRYLDERDSSSQDASRLNLFTANIETQHAMLYGKIPSADVARHFEDSADDVARVAAEMLERLLTPLSEDDSYVSALGYALEDRLLPGLGFVTVRYEVETEPAVDESGSPVLDEAGEPVETKVSEKVETDYHYWKSVLWSPCRTFQDSRWFAWSAPMTQEALKARFGDAIAKTVPLNTGSGKKNDPDAVKANPWATADVWEIWSKQDRRVYWFVEGMVQILDERDDPLDLDGFYPFPKPLIARATTRSFVPRADFVLGQDLYNEIDNLTSRIKLLEDAIRVTGVYDQAQPEIALILSETGANKLYPAQNMAALVEGGGIEKAIGWFPIEQIVKAIGVLTEKRLEKIGLLQQVTGWSDIMRGQSAASETLGAQKLKAQYGSVRIAKFQGEFARFASDLQRIRAEIIAKHFDAKTIIERSNVLATPDAEHAEAAAQLIKSNLAAYRIEVKPESINLTDYAQLKQERTEIVASLGGLIAAAAPLVESMGPPAAEFVLATGAWLLAGTKGGDSLEAEFDNFRAKVQALASQPPPAAQPDPTAMVKAQAEREKASAAITKSKLDTEATIVEHGIRMREIQAETAADVIRNATQPPPPPGVA